MRSAFLVLAGSTALAGYAAAQTAREAAAVSQAAVGPVRPGAENRPQIGSFGFDVAGMDRSVAPAENFYRFANGAWAKNTPIPADRSNYGMFTVLEELSIARSRAILDEAAKSPGSKIGNLYASFLDEAAADAKGATPLRPTITAIKAATTRQALATRMGELLRAGIATPFTLYVGPDDKAPDRYVVNSYQGGLGMPDRDYYLSNDAKLVETRKAYQAFVAKLLTLAGEPRAEERAAAVVAFETKLAQAHWTRIESRDADRTYNFWARDEFSKRAPGFEWPAFFAATGLARQPRFIVGQPSAFAGMARAIGETPVPVLQDYLIANSANALAPYLSQPFVEADFAFNQTVLSGTPQNSDRWKRGVNLVKEAIGEELGKIYVERHFTPETKAAADALVKNVVAAMGARIDGLAWMAPETKAKARAKLAAFTPKIGYPETWRDYSKLAIRRYDLVGNVLAANRFEWLRNLNKLGKPIDRGEWFMTPMEINAYANPVMNEIVFPAAILQPPFFDPNADPAINYGGIGAVIGHEISHHFDDQGRKYDMTGKLTDWWSPADVQRFTALTDKLVTQYDAYEPLPGQKVQGKLTLGENIADLAGLTVAYEAYRLSLGGKNAPVLDGFSGDQRFYLGWAQVWRRNYREANLRQRLLTDPHSPSEQRAAVVRNLDPWYAAYRPKPGAPLFLAPEARVRIW